jgi:hypothetical protein
MNKEAQAREIIKGLGFDVEGTEVISGGYSGSTIVRVGDFVVRFWNMKWKDDFAQDLACQRIAGEAGYGPKVFHFDEGQGITVMEYLKPERVGSLLEAVVDLLKKIHEGPQVPEGIDRSKYLDELFVDLAGKRADLNRLREIKDQVFERLGKVKKVPCHRDLHFGNLIFNKGRFQAIDYTWGSMDDAYADLANVALFACRDVADENKLLQLYLKRDPTREEKARLSLMKIPAKIFYGLEFLGLSKDRMYSKPICYKDFGQRDVVDTAELKGYSNALLHEVLEYAASHQFQEDLHTV